MNQTNPYYEVDVSSTAGTSPAWTAKLLFVAVNAWSPAQDAWLKTALARSTTYTFVVSHEPTADPRDPGVTPADAAIAQAKVTMVLCGHTHELAFDTRANQLIVGNGGAPISHGSYGYAVVSQMADGNIALIGYDLMGNPLEAGKVTPAGKPVP